jgi:hypothetical protein
MKRSRYLNLAWVFVLLFVAGAGAEQTVLKAYAPAGSDGSRIILEIDWAQVTTLAPEVDHVSLRRRPTGPPVSYDTVAVFGPEQNRVTDSGLVATEGYHYLAYFKDADNNTLLFGSYPAIAYLGPIHTRPGH